MPWKPIKKNRTAKCLVPPKKCTFILGILPFEQILLQVESTLPEKFSYRDRKAHAPNNESFISFEIRSMLDLKKVLSKLQQIVFSPNF